MARPGLTELTAFAAIATHRSFRRAADDLGLSPSTLSHMIRSLEQRIGVRLFNRTTRSVAVTEAGERLAARLKPVLRELEVALDEVDDFRRKPTGTVRINCGEIAARALLTCVLPRFRTLYPDVRVDLVSEGRLVDIVAEGFDAGIRLAEALPSDMVAVPFGGNMRLVPVASPRYLQGRRLPRTPDDLKKHDCIRLRLPSGKLYKWEFEKRGQQLTVEVGGPVTLDNPDLMVTAAREGLGVAFVFEQLVRADVEAGRLVMLLEDWCPTFPGMFLYYPGHRHVPPALRVFIDTLRMTVPK
jgi:DNA-binding transcriptional LysR family regulator